MESIKNNYPTGMRFKMRFEGEEALEQRYYRFNIKEETKKITPFLTTA